MNPDPNFDLIELPDGTIVGTGLLIPLSADGSFPLYEDAGPMLTEEAILNAAKSGQHKGRDRFDKSYVKNQRSHGSCNGFAVASAMGKARERRGLDRVDLSGAYAYSLMNGGRDNGSTLDDGMVVVTRNGIAEERFANWDQIYPSRYDKSAADENAKQYKAFECYTVRSKLGLFSALACGFDCVIAVHADNGFMKLDSNGVAQGGNGPGNHSVHCDGLSFESGKLAGDMQNSWDVTYGQNGRSYVTWEQHLANTTRYHPFFAFRSTLDSSGTNPPVANV
jgi:hypothetical protein